MLDVLAELGVKRLHVEENYPVVSGLKKQASERKQALVIEPFKSTGNKERRLKNRLPALLNSGSVTFDPSVLSDDETVRQLRALRATPGLPANDDRIDCLEWLVSHFEGRVNYRDPNNKRETKIARWAG